MTVILIVIFLGIGAVAPFTCLHICIQSSTPRILSSIAALLIAALSLQELV
jgi:hypothetical protein